MTIPVYVVVTSYDYEGDSIHGAFDTWEGAEACRVAHTLDDWDFEQAQVQVFIGGRRVDDLPLIERYEPHPYAEYLRSVMRMNETKVEYEPTEDPDVVRVVFSES